MNAFLATCCLKEPLRKRDVVGMGSIIAGVVLLVLGVPQTTVRVLSSQPRTHEQALVSLKVKETVDAGAGRTKAVKIEGG